MRGPSRRSQRRAPLSVGLAADSFEVRQFGFVVIGNRRGANLNFSLGKAVAARNYLDLARPVVRADDQQRQATKRSSMVSVKRLYGSSIAIIYRLDFARAGYAEVQEVVGGGTQIPILILDSHGYKGKIVAICVNHITIG